MPRRAAPAIPHLPPAPLGTPPQPPDLSRALARLVGSSRHAARRRASPLPRRAPAPPIARAVRSSPAVQAAQTAQRVRQMQRAQQEGAQEAAQHTPAARQARAAQQAQQTQQAQQAVVQAARATRGLAQPAGAPAAAALRPPQPPQPPRAAPPTRRLPPTPPPTPAPQPPQPPAPRAAPPTRRLPPATPPTPQPPARKPGHLLGPAYHAPATPQPEPYRGWGASGPLQDPTAPVARGTRAGRRGRAPTSAPVTGAQPAPPPTLAEQEAALRAQRRRQRPPVPPAPSHPATGASGGAEAPVSAPAPRRSLGEALAALAQQIRARQTAQQRRFVQRMRERQWAEIDAQLRELRQTPPDEEKAR